VDPAGPAPITIASKLYLGFIVANWLTIKEGEIKVARIFQ
jgi:hypothetical protein